MLSLVGLSLLIGTFFLILYYSHDEETSTDCCVIISRIVIFLGLSLTWATVLFFPLDVSNSRADDLPFRMDLLWIIIYFTTAIFVLIIIPTCIYWYEADSDWTCVCFLF